MHVAARLRRSALRRLRRPEPINTIRSTLPTFFLVYLCLSGCSTEETRTISLLDQIPKEAPAGPWRVVNDFRVRSSFAKDPALFKNLKIDDKRLIQTDDSTSIRVDAAVRHGEDVYILLIYGSNMGGAKSVEASLDQNGASRTDTVVHPTERELIEFTARGSGARFITIVHRGEQGDEFPLERAIVMAMDKGISQQERSRLQKILSIRHREFASYHPKNLELRRFPFELGGSTHEGLVLVAGDSILFDIPMDSRHSLLRFWTVPLEGEVTIEIDAEARGQWNELECNRTTAEGQHPWQRWDAKLSGVPEYGKLRFSIPDHDTSAAAFLCEPILVPEAGAKSDQMNLLIVDLDTMRADRLGCYGYRKRPTSATLDSILNDKGFFLFNRAYSTAPWTLPATASFLTGRYVSNYPWKSDAIGVLRGCETMAEILRKKGLYCAAFTGGGQLRIEGFERGFHEYYWGSGSGKVETTFLPAERWLRRGVPGSFFLFLHTYEPHYPYTRGNFCVDLPRGRLGNINENEELLAEMFQTGEAEMSEEERTYIDAAYDGGIRTACEATVDFFRVMDDLGLWENSVVVILSDHGEELWDHSGSYAKHGHSLYGELLDIPLMMYVPKKSQSGLTRINETVSLIDLVPTIMELYKIPEQDVYDGTSLVSLMKGEGVERNHPVIAMKWGQKYGRTPRFAMISNEWKYIDDYYLNVEWERKEEYRFENRPINFADPHAFFDRELYLIREDSLELENRADDKTSIADEMREKLGQSLIVSGFAAEIYEYSRSPQKDNHPAHGFSADLEAQLRMLGYME